MVGITADLYTNMAAWLRGGKLASRLVQRILLFFLKSIIIFLCGGNITVCLMVLVLIHHGGKVGIQEVVAEGDDVWLVRPLTKSAEKLSCIRVKGDLV